nr:unnamed protein product [Callosobruchus chinensis]
MEGFARTNVTPLQIYSSPSIRTTRLSSTVTIL